MKRAFILVLLVSILLPLAPAPFARLATVHADAAGRALQFNGTSQYVTLGRPNGFTANSPTWVAGKFGNGLQFNTTGSAIQSVTFGRTARLGLRTFTLEAWFYWTGGSGTSTGTNGLSSAIPLVTKGRGEAENSNVDCNYFFGIDTASSKLAADFEEGAGQPSPGLNHPVIGNTVVTQNAWHHGAVTYDGRYWKLYLDGALDRTLDLGATIYPRWDSIQHAGLATAMTSNGTAAGYFNGILDEVRIWNYARTAEQIQASMNSELPSAAGLVGRWGMNETSGTFVPDSSTPDTLGLSTFTLEAWFYWTGGSGTSTGANGLSSAIPLVTKGRGEAENSNVDCNYFFGIDTASSKLAADFEEGAGQPSPGLNHPVIGNTVVTQNAWHHGAVTYDGRYWKLYLDGALDRTLDLGATIYPRSDSIQHAGLATAMTSNGTAAGYFGGVLDEVRIWNYARTAEQIQASMNSELPSAAGLVGRWGMNEGSGWRISDSSGGNLYGDLYADPTWVDGFPLPDSTPPDTPTDLTATPGGQAVLLSWTANSEPDLAGYNVYRSETSPVPTTTPINAGLVTSASYADATAADGTTYYYAVTAVDTSDNESGASNEASAATLGWDTALDLDGSGDYVTFGRAPGLGAAQFTLEAWIKREGTGTVAYTGSQGVYAVPLITKGLHEDDGSTVDANYFLGIQETTNVLAADFEDMATGLNHPVTGSTPIPADAMWHHVAATYDGTTWKLYLDGNLDATLVVGSYTPRYDSIQHAGLGVAMNSSGTTEGAFNGVMDEVRIWNYARSQQQIQDNLYAEILSADGLLGRWGMDEALGTTIYDSTAAPRENGAVNGNPVWVCGKFATNCGLRFDGTNDYVTFGQAPGLGVTNFTLETWFYWTGGGVAMTTSSSQGLPSVIPLVSKGRGEADGSNVDMNYFLGIDTATHALAVDFEDMATGMNYPFVGSTAVSINTWHHAAATYDSVNAVYNLYLDGQPAGSVDLGSNIIPRYDSIQHAGLATAMNSSGTPAGYFQGVLDEVRIWNVARSQTDIQATMNQELTSGTGLVARWSLNENQGTTVSSSVGSFPGTLTNGPYWVNGAPITPLPPAPPDGAPTNLTAIVAPGSQIDLAWTDNSSNESGFAVEYAVGPACNSWSALGTTGANVTTFRHWNTAVDTQYCYRVRATSPWGNSNWSNTATASTPESYSALSLGRDRAYVRMTSADQSAIGLKQFTVETWFRREGPGVYNTTGDGGIPQAIPLIAKGAAQEEGTTADENFLLVIDDATDVIGADFEECDPADTPAECPAGGTAGLNHPVLGVTPITLNTWHHAAVTYDGTTWRLYLDGSLERELTVGRLPRWDNASPAGLGTSMRTTGAAQGFFDGSLDEVRIWNYARTQDQIRGTMNAVIPDATPGLVARWSLDEATGTSVSGSAGTSINGSIYPSGTATGWNWTADAPFNATLRPNLPTSPDPDDGTWAAMQTEKPGTPVKLQATVSDPDSNNLTVTFYGRPYCETAPNFTVVVLPDTQYYCSQTNGGARAMFDAQTQWIVNNRTARNIVYVTHLGDIVDSYGDTAQWDIAGKLTSLKGALTALDDADIPYGLAVGNHDGAPGNTANFNSYFPFTRVGDGHYETDNDNHYGLFSVPIPGGGTLDFIVIHVEYDASDAVRAWANHLLADLDKYPNRRAIVVTHNLLSGSSTPASFTTEGQALYDALKANPNLFLMLGGHLDTEVSRTDTYNGHTVYSLRSDYQTRNGGNGWLRILEFQPTANQIQVYTYSPYLDQWETDANSQFTLPYDMGGQSCAPFQLIGEVTGVSSGSSPSVDWAGLTAGVHYEWYVTVSDGVYTISGPVWDFYAGNPTAVKLLSFTATAVNESILLKWETSSEMDNLGFNLYRATQVDGPRTLVNEDLIPTLVNPGSPAGAVYTYKDMPMRASGAYFYWLECVDLRGMTKLHGPVSARLGPIRPTER